MKNNSKRKTDITDTKNEEIILSQGGINLLIKAHDDGIDIRSMPLVITQ